MGIITPLKSEPSTSHPGALWFEFMRIYCRVSAIAAIAMGVLILCGWAFQIESLKSIFPGSVAASPNSALLLALSGVSLLILFPGTARAPVRHLARFLAILVTTLGTATRMEYLLSVNWGIDHLLFARQASAAGTSFAGRMSPTSSASFIAIGLSLLFLERETKRGRRPSQGLSLWPALVSLLVLTSYAYHATVPNKVWLYTRIPMPVAVALFLLSGAIFFARPHGGIAGDLTGEGSGSVMARRLLPAIFLIPIFLGWIFLKGERSGFYGMGLGLAIYSAASVVVFAFLVWLNTRKLNAEYAQRRAAETEIRTLNAELEGRVVERTQALERQTAVLAQQAALLDLAHDAIIVRDMNSRILFWSRGAEGMYGWPAQLAVGKIGFELLKESSAQPLEEIEARVIQQGHWEGEVIHHTRDGDRINVGARWALQRDTVGAPARILIINSDITDRKTAEEALRKSEAQLTYSAQHDFLTGLPNRMLLNDRVNQAIISAPRVDKKVSVLFLDLDGFKHINDSLGHPIGDKLLQSVAERLVKCVRATDTVSRQGGDEFVVLLSEMAHSEDAAITARRLLQAVAEAHSIDQHELYVTASIGVSVYPDDGLDAEALIKNADTAMYQSKENGRQSYQFFKPAMNVRAVERQSMEDSLRRALERNEFSLVYQPKVSLKTGEITGAEALLRWTHPNQGAISPARFIPVAEDSGLIVAIDKWVLRQASTQARMWLDAGLPLVSIGVNVSAMEFRNEKFLEGVFGILNEAGLDPRFLELELTESVLMKHPASTESILKSLRARGVQLAVDDFGTGYSSLSYLRKFSMDVLKIDQSFIRQITKAPNEAPIVTAMISLGRSLNLRVVAEGVETQEELAFLQDRQCDEAQGFYFSRPVTPQQLAKLLACGIPEPTAAGH